MMKKRMQFLIGTLCTILLLVIGRASAETEPIGGQCGYNLQWSYDTESKTLTITGSGEMYNYDYVSNDHPWKAYCEEIETVILPDGLTTIGVDAFRGCSALTEITIPEGVVSIGSHAFDACRKLGKIILPESLESIESCAFEACSALTEITIPDSVVSIGSYSFDNCDAMTTIRIGSGLTEDLWGSTFAACAGLKQIIISEENPSYCDVDGVLFSKDKSTLWRFPQGRAETEYIIPGEVVQVGASAFSYCPLLESVVMSDGVTIIGIGSFRGCSSLKSITIPDGITEIGTGAFHDCYALESITIPDGVTAIEESTFNGCMNLNNIRIGNGIETVDEYAFYRTGYVSQFQETYGDGPVYLDYLLIDCVGSVPETVTIAEGTRVIAGRAFADCSGFKYVEMPESLCTVCKNAFRRSGVERIDLPEGVETLEESAFANCASLQTVTIPKSLKSIEKLVFVQDTALTDVYYLGTEKQFERDLKPNIGSGNYKFDPRSSAHATWHFQEAASAAFEEADVQYNGATPYVIYDGTKKEPRVTVKDTNGDVMDNDAYTVEYRDNTAPGTAYADITWDDSGRKISVMFKIYLPATTGTTVANAKNGIKIAWTSVDGAAGYVIYRRAWSSTTNGWTSFERWNNTPATSWTDTKVYAGTRYQYGVKAYFAQRTDPVSGAKLGGAMDNFNLGVVGPLKTTARITTRSLKSVTAGTRQLTAKWDGSKVFTGYQVQIATDAGFTKNAQAVKVKNTAYQTTFKNLKAKTTYYVRVRSYHELAGMTYFGEWSNVLSCKVR